MKQVKRVTMATALALIAALIPGAGTASAAPLPCSGVAREAVRHGLEQIQLRTLELEASTDKKSYRIGEVIKFKALVTRPADEDPAGQGIPMDRPYVSPAPDINVGVGLLFNGDVFLPGFGITDENGEVTLKVKIVNYVKPGTVHASFFAWKTVADIPCARVDETGYLPVSDIVTVKPGAF